VLPGKAVSGVGLPDSEACGVIWWLGYRKAGMDKNPRLLSALGFLRFPIDLGVFFAAVSWEFLFYSFKI